MPEPPRRRPGSAPGPGVATLARVVYTHAARRHEGNAWTSTSHTTGRSRDGHSPARAQDVRVGVTGGRHGGPGGRGGDHGVRRGTLRADLAAPRVVRVRGLDGRHSGWPRVQRGV